MYLNKQGQWKLINIVINGVNLGLTFRNQFYSLMEKEGNNLEEVEKIILEAKASTGQGKPIVIIMSTVMGNGVDYMMGTHKWHGVAPNDEQLANALNQLKETLGDY